MQAPETRGPLHAPGVHGMDGSSRASAPAYLRLVGNDLAFQGCYTLIRSCQIECCAGGIQRGTVNLHSTRLPSDTRVVNTRRPFLQLCPDF